MAMNDKQISDAVAEIRKLNSLIEELQADVENLKDELKATMQEQGREEIAGYGYKITWKTITSSRFDTTAFRKACPDVAAAFTKEQACRRFVIS